jgi:hypothetical protein
MHKVGTPKHGFLYQESTVFTTPQMRFFLFNIQYLEEVLNAIRWKKLVSNAENGNGHFFSTKKAGSFPTLPVF